MNPQATSVKLSFVEKFGYGLGDTASNFVWALMMNFIMYYYTDIFGITAAAAGTMLLFARSTDGVVDFFIGALADRTKSKWGRFRPYLVWLCVPLAVVFVLAFTTPNLSPAGKIVWAWVTYNLLMLLYSAINIPYGALSGVMTDDPLERTSLNSYRMSLAQIGGIIANSSFMVLIVTFGGENQAAGAQRTVLLFAAVAIVLFLISFWTTTERIHPPATQKTRLIQDLKTLFLNRHWIMMFVFGIVNITLAVIRSTAGIYYLENFLKWDGGRIGTWFLISGLSMIFGAMMTRFAVKALGKKWAFITTIGLIALTAVPFYWIPANLTTPVVDFQVFGRAIQVDQTTVWVFTCQILGMIFAGINATLFWALVADTADFQEWKFKVRTTGVVFSATTCAQKAGMGVGAAFAGFLISYYGYVPNAEQTPEAIHGILLLVSLIPAIGLVVLAAFFTLYGLNEHVCTTMREELAQRRGQDLPAGPAA
ncbi:MAG: MFS transporter [Verrucomicrobia bacterium]|nr:MFS transporter [Verrucomicrobiota bacterium]